MPTPPPIPPIPTGTPPAFPDWWGPFQDAFKTYMGAKHYPQFEQGVQARYGRLADAAARAATPSPFQRPENLASFADYWAGQEPAIRARVGEKNLAAVKARMAQRYAGRVDRRTQRQQHVDQISTNRNQKLAKAREYRTRRLAGFLGRRTNP